MTTATDLPSGVQSLSELIEIESTTQSTLYVPLRDIVHRFSTTLNP